MRIINFEQQDNMDLLFEAVRENDNDKCVRWSNECVDWANLKMIMEMAGDSQQMDTTNDQDDELQRAIRQSLNDQ